MRTQDEILARYNERKDNDFFGFESNEYLRFLDYEHAKQFLKPEVAAKEWEPEKKTLKEIMVDYMPFAWEKANGCRGISSGRSIMHYTAWLWLDGDEEIWPTLADYEFYGKDQLVTICKYLGLDSEKWDDHRRVISD